MNKNSWRLGNTVKLSVHRIWLAGWLLHTPNREMPESANGAKQGHEVASWGTAGHQQRIQRDEMEVVPPIEALVTLQSQTNVLKQCTCFS